MNQLLAVTLLHVNKCHVLQVNKTKNDKGYVGVQIGTGEKKLKNSTAQLIGHCAKVGLTPKSKIVIVSDESVAAITD